MSLFPTDLETERLQFEHLHPDRTDVLELYEHAREGAHRIEETTEYLAWDPHATPKETLAFVEQAGEEFEASEGASYLVRPTEGEDGVGELAGIAGVGVDWQARTATLGTWLRPAFWGRGYSGERARRFMALAFDRLDLALVAVTHHVDNEQSRRAIEKYVERAGGRREGTIRNGHVDDDGTPRDVVRYSVSRGEWAANAE